MAVVAPISFAAAWEFWISVCTVCLFGPLGMIATPPSATNGSTSSARVGNGATALAVAI